MITKNAIKCKHCGDVIESHYTHESKHCRCGTCAVDGGHDYLKRCYKHSPEEDFEELSDGIDTEEDDK